MTLTVQCPTCSASVEWVTASEWRPFCSERCKLIDLGAWASESYRVPDQSMSPDAPEFTTQPTRSPDHE